MRVCVRVHVYTLWVGYECSGVQLFVVQVFGGTCVRGTCVRRTFVLGTNVRVSGLQNVYKTGVDSRAKVCQVGV